MQSPLVMKGLGRFHYSPPNRFHRLKGGMLQPAPGTRTARPSTSSSNSLASLASPRGPSQPRGSPASPSSHPWTALPALATTSGLWSAPQAPASASGPRSAQPDPVLTPGSALQATLGTFRLQEAPVVHPDSMASLPTLVPVDLVSPLTVSTDLVAPLPTFAVMDHTVSLAASGQRCQPPQSLLAQCQQCQPSRMLTLQPSHLPTSCLSGSSAAPGGHCWPYVSKASPIDPSWASLAAPNSHRWALSSPSN
ncbi:hypothetical protein A6R68_01678 [Neotoma lepida]|uniref:Uncharacterized protein n=1 Tax=Neotoma lepida TaxID=56216 RepID=A0A1A6GUD3_NEOLE|nr:hypothetical protein A6R68_01678 [Neotoma lepida]